MLKLEDYFNEKAIDYVKNSNDDLIKKMYNSYLECSGVEEARAIGWVMLRNGHTKEDAFYGLGWILKSIDIYEKHEYNDITSSQLDNDLEQKVKNEYVRSLEGVSSVFLPKLSRVNDVLKKNAQMFIEPNLEIGLEYLLKAISFDCVSSDALLNMSVAYFDGLLGEPDYDKAQYYLGMAISKDRYELTPEFVAFYFEDIKEKRLKK